MIKLFIFDLDGVLTSTSEQHYNAWKLLCEENNIKVSRSIEEKTKGVSRMDSLNIILKEANNSRVYSNEEKLVMTSRKNDIYIELISKYDKSLLFDGVIELFKYLKKKNILIALGSASLNGPKLLKRLEIFEYFDYIVDPSVLKSKPAPDIFSSAAKHFKIENKECVGIEDAFAGVKAINKADMYSIGIGSDELLYEADVVFSDVKSIDFEFLDDLIKEC